MVDLGIAFAERENLLRVQRRLSFGHHTVQGPDTIPPTIESDELFTAIQGKTFDPLCIETHKKASGKSRRKQKHTNWIAPPKIHQYSNQEHKHQNIPALIEEPSKALELQLEEPEVTE
ncbi:hypothetical protein CRUP_004789 [Coryphaenoides rupestris]|nr:hypothetical protein CRUP_004789 [Coryphaenoides rupestris]